MSEYLWVLTWASLIFFDLVAVPMLLDSSNSLTSVLAAILFVATLPVIIRLIPENPGSHLSNGDDDNY